MQNQNENWLYTPVLLLLIQPIVSSQEDLPFYPMTVQFLYKPVVRDIVKGLLDRHPSMLYISYIPHFLIYVMASL